MGKSIPDIPPTAAYAIASWRGLTFLWAILALAGTWYQPSNGQSYSLWDNQTPTSSDSDAARVFTIFTFMFSAFQVITIVLHLFKIIGAFEWMHCLFDFLIWLCAVIAFAVYNGSGWGRDMMKATFSFALIMWVFGAVFIFPGFFREQFVRFIDKIDLGQVRSVGRRSTKKEKTRVEKSDDNVDQDGIQGPPPFTMPQSEPASEGGTEAGGASHIVTPSSLAASDIENPKANRDRVESVDLN
ncbi:hypothetical protein TrCOL_g6248 [Triparma columacea]|uniref:Uncharacterized protein n=1 Tax=Triparma columacea TaxID=722753 RepID=A0A9W7L483_9STRA|nr:hypothetical protein TrCOL_g6248 [Triparma columacea]